MKDPAELAEVAFPDKLAVTTLAEKLPFESRIAILPGVLEDVAELAAVEPDATRFADNPPT